MRHDPVTEAVEVALAEVGQALAEGVDLSGSMRRIEAALARARRRQRAARRQVTAGLPRRPPRAQRPRCEATTRSGRPCQALRYWPRESLVPQPACIKHGGGGRVPEQDAAARLLARLERAIADELLQAVRLELFEAGARVP